MVAYNPAGSTFGWRELWDQVIAHHRAPAAGLSAGADQDGGAGVLRCMVCEFLLAGEIEMAADFGRRFGELIQEADEIEARKAPVQGPLAGAGRYYVNESNLLTWTVKATQLIFAVCGAGSHQFSTFRDNDKIKGSMANYGVLQRLRAIVLAAKDDYEGGYLNSIRNLIHAEVFDTELEQADELLTSGYYAPAAVVAGVVLETTLRQMCEDQRIEAGKLDKMNADLANAGVFNKLVQKQITAWAGVRNMAAHGKTDQFTKDDVSAMIRDVRRFVAERLS